MSDRSNLVRRPFLLHFCKNKAFLIWVRSYEIIAKHSGVLDFVYDQGALRSGLSLSLERLGQTVALVYAFEWQLLILLCHYVRSIFAFRAVIRAVYVGCKDAT